MLISRSASYLTAGLLSCGVLYAAGQIVTIASASAQEARQETGVAATMERGKVKSFQKNDRDDVDGLVLESGVSIHFPPHLGKRITSVVKIGDEIEATGRFEVTPRGEKVFEITRLISGKETITVERPRPPAGPRGPQHEEAMNAAGKVTDYARNPHGDIDGLLLQDETVVKFPPHQSRELQQAVAIGDQVKIEGRRHVTPRGEVHLHADKIEAKGTTIERDESRHGPRGPRGPHHPPRHFEEDGPTNADLLRELKAIRELVEKQQQS